MKKLLLIVPIVVLALLPSPALAHDSDDGTSEDSFVLRVNGSYHLEDGQEIDTAVVINADAEISGTVHDALVVINGDAEIAANATVEGSVTIVNGDLTMRSGATVEDDVTLVRSDLHRASGAVVGGEVRRRSAYLGFGSLGILFSIYLWLAGTAIVLVAGAVFALVGGLQLNSVAVAMRERTGETILSTLVIWVAIPLVAVVSFLTIVGIPLGISLFLFVAPALFFLGYIASGAFVGTLVLPGRQRPVGPVLLGLAILQVVTLVPVIGWVTAIFASLWGAGGLVYVAFRGMRRGGTLDVAATPS